MKKSKVFFKDDSHRWIIVARDPERPNILIDTNEYLIDTPNEALLCDPGGLEIFPAVFAGISQTMDPRKIKTLFASHQDPDIISSLSLWMEINPDIRCYISTIWKTFVHHFGGREDTLVGIPDEGGELSVGDCKLQFVPAHYLHSSGNHHLYDPSAKILFSGDVGAAMLGSSDASLFVTDFDRHIPKAEGFHRRWMGSNDAKRDWCERAMALKIDMLCPQHGAIYSGKDVERFINWFSELPVGVLRTPAPAT